MLRNSGKQMNINTEDIDSPGGDYDNFVSDMGKTSNFGGEINSAALPISPAGSRLQFNQPDFNAVASNVSAQGSMIS